MVIEYKTGFEAGLSGIIQIVIAMREIVRRGGSATMDEIYCAIEKEMNGSKLSDQGRASLRYYVNRDAVKKGWIHPFIKGQEGWRITELGRSVLRELPELIVSQEA